MACVHCGIDVGNRMVIFGKDTIYCYTCGRLKADDRCRINDSRRQWISLKVLEARKDMYK